MNHKLKIRGYHKVRLLDRDGTLLREATIPNGITNIGKDTLLDVMFVGSAPITSWYAGLIDSTGYSGVSSGDTMASHSGWNELVSYLDTERPQWQPDSADAQAIINPITSYIDFTVIGNQILKGIFIASDNTKGGSAGVLWSTALFSNSNVGDDWSVSDGQLLQIQYGVSVA